MPDNAILFYDYVPDILERRGPHREAHLAILRELYDRGDCVVAGPTGDPVSGGLFVFRSAESAEEFYERDPYVAAGLVTGHRVVPMTIALP